MELRMLAKRIAFVGIVSVVVATVSVYGIVSYQDWSKPQRIRNFQLMPPLSAENPPSPESFMPQQVVPAMPAITEIKTVSAEDVTDEISDDELVIGVVIDGNARAYSINMLTGPSREIFNDVLADEPIATTW